MKHAKKLASLLLALVMVLGLATTAFAAGNDGTITISNATVGETYAVYKVFDLTYEGDAVAYSYTKTGESDALYTALTSETSPFTLTTVTTTDNVYSVSLKAGKTAADVSKFLTDNKTLLTQTGDTKTANSATVTFENLPYGYYYITSSVGTVVTIDSAKKDVTVIDKNQKPGWDPKDPTNPDESGEQGKFVAAATTNDQGQTVAGDYGKTSTAAINDTAYFKINAFAPKYAGDKLVAAYTFTDTLANGFTYKNDLKVMLGGTELTKDTDYTVSVADDSQTITVVVKAGTITNYPVEAHLSITYSATVDKDAVYDNVNTADMSWTVYPNNTDGDPDTGKTPYDPNDPTDPNNPGKDPKDPSNPTDSKTDTYVFGFNVQKYKEEAKAGNELTGAKFKLYDAATGGKEIPVVMVSTGVYRVAVAGETGVEIEAGAAQIFGLDAKTYYLEETVAPAGYNILTERVAVKIVADTVDAEGQAVDNVDDNGILNSKINVINNAGALLPSTGGMGTTLFYVIGGLLVVCAAVLLVTRKRMGRAAR